MLARRPVPAFLSNLEGIKALISWLFVRVLYVKNLIKKHVSA
jgi:hypothetical protein